MGPRDAAGLTAVRKCGGPAGWRTVLQVAVLAIVIGVANVAVDGGIRADGGTAVVPPAPEGPLPRPAGGTAGETSGEAGSTASDSEIIEDETIPTWT